MNERTACISAYDVARMVNGDPDALPPAGVIVVRDAAPDTWGHSVTALAPSSQVVRALRLDQNDAARSGRELGRTLRPVNPPRPDTLADVLAAARRVERARKAKRLARAAKKRNRGR